MIIHHITLLTGHITTHRLDVLDAGAVAACRALLPAGGPIPGFPAFRVTIATTVFTVWRGKEPLLTCGVGTGRDATWRELEVLHTQFAPIFGGKLPPPAPAGQWLGVALLPPIAMLTQSDIGWLGDFERCLAAAILLPTP